MTLDPAVVQLLSTMPAADPGAPMPTAAELREAFQASWVMPSELPPVGSVTDLAVPGPAGDIPIRVYLPATADPSGPLPVFYWIHGGGWTVGSLQENELPSRAVCNAAQVAVLALDYRLAPEHRYPAAVEDCYAVLEWIYQHGGELGLDPRRLAVGGESAGGNLASVISMLSRDRGGPAIAAQVAISPVYGHPSDGYESYRLFAQGYGMTAEVMSFFFEQYVESSANLDDPYLLPLRSADLAGLPRALVLTAEFDVLRDEGEEFARRLQAAGVPTELVRYDGQIHGFYGLYTSLPASARGHAQVADFLRQLWSS
ncbi:MAG: alpha/beta hydrolase fold domain-containing protein [Actinomycetota bacterium]|nr:alpha/beta hydrolase fold domain-containing protein [Actinomycetota bacterium]MDQ2955765.1 alpha/beta hydrolase fold domain-containing protein [Actinomycetota bacterium]